MKKKVIEITFEDDIDRKVDPYGNGIVITTEDGKRYKMNLCESQCLVAFMEIS